MNTGAQAGSSQINIEVISPKPVDVEVIVRPRDGIGSGLANDYSRDVVKGCLYHNPGKRQPDEYASWSGRCDQRGYITGPGRLVYTYPSGAPDNFRDYLEGMFRDGKLHGKGRVVGLDGQRRAGTFSDGRLNGNGEQVFSNGARYVGSFQNGDIAGTGRLIKADGTVYEGEFAANKAHGFGFFRSPDGTCFEGTFRNNASVSGHRWNCE